MKTLKTFLIFFIALVLIFIIHSTVSVPLMCEGLGQHDQTNYYLQIEEWARNQWCVMFHNVKLTYWVTMTDDMYKDNVLNHNFKFKQLTPGAHDLTTSERLTMNRVNTTIVDAVRDHYNDIQSRRVHANFTHYIEGNLPANIPNPVPRTTPREAINNPLDQFVVNEFMSILINLGANVRFVLSSMAVYLGSSSGIAVVLHLLYNKAKGLLCNLWSLNKESIYGTIHGIVINQINIIKGQKFLPFVYTLFTFIFINNLVGMIPYNFSTTSHFLLTFFLSFTVVLGASILGLKSRKDKFFSIFVPEGCPIPLLPLLVLIESISYLARNVSLGLRLAANVLSGHMLLNILSGFTYKAVIAGIVGFIIALIPLTFISGFTTLEIGICFIQSQVFSVLSSSYIKDGV